MLLLLFFAFLVVIIRTIIKAPKKKITQNSFVEGKKYKITFGMAFFPSFSAILCLFFSEMIDKCVLCNVKLLEINQTRAFSPNLCVCVCLILFCLCILCFVYKFWFKSSLQASLLRRSYGIFFSNIIEEVNDFKVK